MLPFVTVSEASRGTKKQGRSRRCFKREDPIGKRILIQEIIPGKAQLGPEIPWQVVEVVANEKENGLDDTVGAFTCLANKTRTFRQPWWCAEPWI